MINRNSIAAASAGLVMAGSLIYLAHRQVSDNRLRYGATTSVDTVVEAIELFKDEGFDLETPLKAGRSYIPPVFLASLPDDLSSKPETYRRKAVFVAVVLAHVLWANEQVRMERSRIERIQRANLAKRSLRTRDRKWLSQVAKKYRTKPMAFDELLRRVDVVPPRLAVAQAAQESGWGTSRFARAGNALFGQHASVGAGAITAKGDTAVGMKAFPTIQQSVLGYMQNLNSHTAYREFWDMRAEMRQTGRPMDAIALAGFLGRYSEEGAIYVDRLRRVMRVPEVAAALGARLVE